MENLNKMDFRELNASEMKQVQGGRLSLKLSPNVKFITDTALNLAEDVVKEARDLVDEIV